MGRRRRRVIRIVKKKLPTVFVCPRCGEEAVRVSIDKTTGKAVVACAICQLKDEFQAHPRAQAIDVYSYFTDRFYGVKDPRAIIPRDRPAVSDVPSEPESEAKEAEEDVEPPTRLPPASESLTPPDAFEEQAGDEAESPKVEGESAEPETDSPSAVEDEAKEKEEEENPFGDILQPDSDKEKKRYSPNPIPQESSSSSSE
ncbi:MAG TPA: hypothetical protein VE177_02520 [Candidatus Binatus sp.]|nr:hypothetical protein [Candidatus Binatus sp.]